MAKVMHRDAVEGNSLEVCPPLVPEPEISVVHIQPVENDPSPIPRGTQVHAVGTHEVNNGGFKVFMLFTSQKVGNTLLWKEQPYNPSKPQYVKWLPNPYIVPKEICVKDKAFTEKLHADKAAYREVERKRQETEHVPCSRSDGKGISYRVIHDANELEEEKQKTALTKKPGTHKEPNNGKVKPIKTPAMHNSHEE